MDRTEITEGHGGTVGVQPTSAHPAPGPDPATGMPSACSGGYKPEDVSRDQARRSSDEETRRRAGKDFLCQVLLLYISIISSSFAAPIIYRLLFLTSQSLFLSFRSFTPAPGLMFHITFIVALVSSSLLLPIPWQRTNRAIKICALLLFAGQVAVVILSTISGSIVPRNHSALFAVIAFGFSRWGSRYVSQCCGYAIGLPLKKNSFASFRFWRYQLPDQHF
jgi:hypothetical protein